MDSWDDNDLVAASRALTLRRRMATFQHLDNNGKKALAKCGSTATTRLRALNAIGTKRAAASSPQKVAQKARKVAQLKRKMSDLSKQQNNAQRFKAKAKADNTVLKLGGDCDGLCTAAVALETMGVKFEHVFASEKDGATRSVLYGNHDVTKVYKDCSSMARSASRTPKCNVYVAGPPCQPWSRAGKNQGYDDDANRGCVLLDVIAYIGSRTPTVFILEEVPNLAYQHKEHFEEILATLNGFMRYGKPIYKVEWAILNTQEHGGLPQNRARLYMVGIRADLLTSEFQWPDAIPPVSIHDVLDPPHKNDEWDPTSMTNLSNLDRMLTKIMNDNGDPNKDTYLIDINQSEKMGDNIMKERSPTLTRSRAMQGGYYVTTHKRMLNTAEMFRLQGFDASRFKYESLTKRSATGKKLKVTEREVRGMIGNAMTVSVVGRVLRAACTACGLMPTSVKDPWKPTR
jgi:DNA-cytosine methyltransferase